MSERTRDTYTVERIREDVRQHLNDPEWDFHDMSSPKVLDGEKVCCNAHAYKRQRDVLQEERDELRAELRRVRRENQWLRNRRNRAVELLTGNPGDDDVIPVTESEGDR